MSFLAAGDAVGLAVVLLPIIIHLINQRRFQTVRWAAMQFLLAANRMSRLRRIRHWLILAARVAPLPDCSLRSAGRCPAGGWGGRRRSSRHTIILLDRSPSMQQLGPGVSRSCRPDSTTGPIAKMFRSSRYVLIDSATEQAIELESPLAAGTSRYDAVSESADIPAMLEVRRIHPRNRPSR